MSFRVGDEDELQAFTGRYPADFKIVEDSYIVPCRIAHNDKLEGECSEPRKEHSCYGPLYLIKVEEKAKEKAKEKHRIICLTGIQKLIKAGYDVTIIKNIPRKFKRESEDGI